MAETDDRKEQDPKDLLDHQSEEARMALPGVYVDKFWLTYWSGHLRLTLGESAIRTGTHWRFAALIEASDVRRLIKRLEGILEKMEPSEDEE